MSENNINDLQKAVGAAAKQQLEKQMEKEIEMRTQIISAAYDRAATYTNLIIFAGYAGTFTLWSFTKDFLPEKAAILIALMMGVSLFIFCGWEVYKMIQTSLSLRKQTNIMLQGLPPEKFGQAIQNEKIQTSKDAVKLYRYWFFVLALTIPLGFGGALLMFYNFVANLLKLPYWPS